jgi:hypothetical protein
MYSNTLNTIIGLVGLIILLVGLIFVGMDVNKYQMYVIPLTGIGASILSTAVVNAILNVKLKDVLIKSVMSALQDKTKFIRHAHSLELRLSREENEIKVIAQHEFTLHNNSKLFKAIKKMAIYTDVGNFSQQRGGFESVEEPSGFKLSGEELKRQTVNENGKLYFRKDYTILPDGQARFGFTTYGYYRMVDRLIWTIQDLATDFSVKIINATGSQNCIRVKINHHNEEEIMERIHPYWNKEEKREEIRFDFNSEILPYQGFELIWDFQDKKTLMNI